MRRRRIVVLPPHSLWETWTDPPPPGAPDREATFRHLAGLGYSTRRLDPFRKPWNPWAGSHAILGGIDPLRALRVLLLHRSSAVVLCFFESSALAILLLRRLLGFRGRVVIYDVGLPGKWRLRNAILKLVVPRADMILPLSSSQVPGLLAVGARPGTVRPVLTLTYPDFFAAAPDRPDGYVLAVGDDYSRDYATLQRASTRIGRAVVIRSRAVAEDRAAYPRVSVMGAELDGQGYRDLLAGACVVVLPLSASIHAGGVSTLLEAMSSAKAVVVSATPGLADYVRDGTNCRVVPAGDAEALARAVGALLADPAERVRLGTQAREFVERSCSPQANAAQLEAAIRALDG